jgi:hypothetical protein
VTFPDRFPIFDLSLTLSVNTLGRCVVTDPGVF